MTMAIYLIKTALCLTAFFLFYRLLLMKKENFTFSRFYLMLTFLLSFIFPLISINIPIVTLKELPAEVFHRSAVAGSVPAGESLIQGETLAGETGRSAPPVFFVALIYLTGMLIFGLRYMVDMVRMIWLITRNRKITRDHYTLVIINRKTAPFSFFRYVFVNHEDLPSEDFRPFILQHELAHIRAWHTLDRLLIGLGQIIQWFNPVILLYKNAVVALHEYSADLAVTKNTEIPTGYQKRILNYTYCKNNLMFTSSLSSTMLKKRFSMMTKQNQGRLSTLKVFASVVIAALLLLAFSSGDKTGSKPYPMDDNSVTKVFPAKGISYSACSIFQDTTRDLKMGDQDTLVTKKSGEDDEIQRLKEEFENMRHRDERIHEPPVPPPPPVPHPGEMQEPVVRQQFGEQKQILKEKQHQYREQQRHLAERQEWMEEKLTSLLENQLSCMDTQRLRMLAKGNLWFEPYRPMVENYFRQYRSMERLNRDEWSERVRPMPRVEAPEHFRYEHRIHPEFRYPCPSDPGIPLNKKMLEDQQQWQKKFHREMEKQEKQLENKRKQLLEEYEQRMKKYAPED